MSRGALVGLWLLCQVAHAWSSLWMLGAIVTGSERARQIALSYDRVANVATGGRWDQTISRRAARGARLGVRRWCLLCRLLDRVDPQHCQNADVTDI
jgi:hypothetical protein